MANQSSTASTYSLPTHLTPHDPSSSSHQPSSSTSSRKKLKQRLDFLPFSSSSPSPSSSSVIPEESNLEARGITTARTNENEGRPLGLGRVKGGNGGKGKGGMWGEWWKTIGKGMVNDVKRRAPFYKSDWVDAWDYRVVPATVYMYFANILPALAFSLDMFTKTHMSFGVNEVLLSSVLGAVVFSLFAAQPLVIVGVTGPITVFNYTVYDIMVPTGTNYFAFMALVGLWSLVMHWILALTNACNALKYVTRFSCDIFGFYVAFIYLQKGIQVLTRQGSEEPFYLSIVVALLVLAVGYLCGVVGESALFVHYVRVFVKDYGTPLTVIFFTGFVHIGKMKDIDLSTLPTSKAFFPTIDRGWFVHFWDISIGDVFIAIPFAILLTILFYFDHNVSSLIAQGTEFPLRKPAGFHWDIFLLGLTTGVAGLLGIPFPNGLIPQAPFHTASLCVTKVVTDPNEEGEAKGHITTQTSHVVEQRLSNLAQGLLTLGTMTGPLLIVIHLIPQGVLAGLFFVMGVQALESNGITLKLLFLFRDSKLTPSSNPLKRISRKAVWGFVVIQLVGFAATFAVTQTIAAVGFPVVILALIPVRMKVLTRWFEEEELRVLDQPTASPFTMVSVGGNYGEDVEVEGDRGRGSEGVLVGGAGDSSGSGEGEESEEARAERGEGGGMGLGADLGTGSREGMKRRESWKSEDRSGRWVGDVGGSAAGGESYEMRKPSVMRRSVSRNEKE